jgi:anti-sigma factor RsiW
MDDEEAELMRRLASGELSPEEEAAVRRRLAEIAAQRAELAAQLLQDDDDGGASGQLALDPAAALDRANAKLALLDAKLNALDDEEAELLRKLASGELSPEEAAAVRRRLAEIAAERERLLQAREAVLSQISGLQQEGVASAGAAAASGGAEPPPSAAQLAALAAAQAEVGAVCRGRVVLVLVGCRRRCSGWGSLRSHIERCRVR